MSKYKRLQYTKTIALRLIKVKILPARPTCDLSLTIRHTHTCLSAGQDKRSVKITLQVIIIIKPINNVFWWCWKRRVECYVAFPWQVTLSIPTSCYIVSSRIIPHSQSLASSFHTHCSYTSFHMSIPNSFHKIFSYSFHILLLHDPILHPSTQYLLASFHTLHLYVNQHNLPQRHSQIIR